MATRILLFLFIPISLTAQIISNTRIISWNSGVRGGIPQVTNVAVTLGPTSSWWFIQSNITAAASNTAVELTPGVYTVTNDITLKQGVVLRGQLGVHPTNYWLKFTNDSGSSSLGNRLVSFDGNSYDYTWAANTPSPITNLVQHSSFVTSMVAHALSANDICIVDQYTNFLIGGYQTNLTETNWVGSNTFVFGDAGSDLMAVTQAGSLGITTWTGRENGKRPFGQFVRIKSVVSSTVVEVEPPLYWAYNRSPEIVKINGWTERAGIENLTLDNLLCNARDNLYVAGALNCWMKDVYVIGSRRRDLWVYGALWFEQRGCNLYGGVPIGVDTDTQYTSDRAYPVFLGPHCTASLFTDNVYEKKTMGFAFEGCASGNVVSYNFITNIYWISQSDKPRRFSILMHGPHPAFNLVEGNWCSDRIRADEYWGSSSHFTVAFNSIHQHDRGATAAQQWTVDIERHNAYWNFVGNLIGGDVNESNYEYINGASAPYNDSVDTIWKIGYKSLGNDNTYYSAHTLSTLLRYYNWCYRTNNSVSGSGITYHLDNVVDATYGQLPKSYYLQNAPTNFGFLTWPPYNPANPAYNSMTNIPAGYRYLFGTNPPMTIPTSSSKYSGIVKLNSPAPVVPHWVDGSSIGNFTNSADWQEISGMATPQKTNNAGYLWVISDSPANMLACVSATNASPQGVYTLQSPPAYVDWEDISSGTVAGQPYIYVADFGDNGSVRATFNILRIKEPTINGAGGIISLSDYDVITCEYPAGNPPISKDAETLLVDPDTGDMYVILKRDAVQKVYKLPYALVYIGTQTLTYEGAMTAIPSVTTVALGATACYAVSGTISPNGSEILIRNYNDIYYFPRDKATQTIIQALQQSLISVPAFVGGGSVSPKKSHPQAEPQGEALCYSPDGRNLYTASEYVSSEGSTVSRYPLFKYTRVLNIPTTVSFQDGVSPTASYAGTSDTYIWGTSPSTVRGAETTIVLDITVGTPTDDRRSLLKFDLTSIPTNAVIVGAKFDFWIAAEGQGWSWYRMLVPWDENSTYTSLSGPISNDGVNAAVAASSVNGINLDTITAISVRDNILVSDVQYMVTNPSLNYGWLGLNLDSATGDGVQLDSRQSVTASRRPKLTIRYIY